MDAKINRLRKTTLARAALAVAAAAAVVACQPIENPTPPVSRKSATQAPQASGGSSGQAAERRPVPNVRSAVRNIVPITATNSEIPGAVQVGPGAGTAGIQGAAGEPGQTLMLPTYGWVNAVSTDSRVGGEPIPVRSVVTAYDPGGSLIGRTVVVGEGSFGPMALYMDDPATLVDEGAVPGDPIRFQINGEDARSIGPIEPVWAFNGAMLRVDLAIGAE